MLKFNFEIAIQERYRRRLLLLNHGGGVVFTATYLVRVQSRRLLRWPNANATGSLAERLPLTAELELMLRCVT